MKVWGVTDIGLVRKENQDAFLLREQTASGHTVCVVCDGMGGSAGGRMASKIATETFMEEMEKVLSPGMEPEGTTLVCAVSYDGGVVISNVGDSRAYHITENGITRITRDHSLVEHMVEIGDITEEEARHHPNRNLVTRVLGPKDANTQSDGYVCPMGAGEYILLCSDGLVDTVTDQEMLFEVIHGAGPDSCLERLMEIARSQGAPDNVTAVLMQKL